MFKLIVASLVLVCGLEWAVILTPSPIKLEDAICPPPAKPIRYPEGMRVPYCKPTGINFSK